MNNTQQEGRLRLALEEIVNPIKFMRERLKDGEELQGYYAVMLSKNASYLQGIAEMALAEFPPSPLTEDELKAKFAQHLGVKELDTSDAYAVEWTMKNINQ